MSKIEDAKIIWKYAYWALDLNEEKAISIFINRPNDELSNELLRSDYIINNLNSYKLALMTYLEYVITTKQSQVRTQTSIQLFFLFHNFFILPIHDGIKPIAN